ncbi:hypothetical protein RFI_00636 [Reticulomyxa filosa]|uniref:alanine--glyoxylate transaminase n=1 Tax=Reticulomyxa filosa TaxID=46433 RepID=X6PE03_RETFI|nr:hypothetical protein RFI_00636 [Reticulomyxa filosa]|eukprot:ETO36426.1 hypothetical protein RFI_00636 [Reticulomyxa filosa]
MALLAGDKKKKLLMVPGPIECDQEVLQMIGQPSESVVHPIFIKSFGDCLRNMRKLFCANESCQPFILSGGGALGWDCTVVSLLESKKDKALVLNTGYFGENFRDCCRAYDIETDELQFPIGAAANVSDLEKQLKKKKYKLLTITQVETSTGVCNDVRELADTCRRVSPETLIAVDGVCSFAAVPFYFSDWNIDIAITASQKALGAPPGLCVMMLSERTCKYLMSEQRKNAVRSWYCNLQQWLPIMQGYEKGQICYFSTPNVNLIKALLVSSQQLLNDGLERSFARHRHATLSFREAMRALNLSLLVPNDDQAAATVTAVWFPPNINPAEFLKYIDDFGVVVSGGLHRKIKTQYFRVGHMGISVNPNRTDLLQTVQAIEYALAKCKVSNFEKGAGISAFTSAFGTVSKL